MTITIGKYTFEGAFTSTANLRDRSGVYAILCKKDGKYYIKDVGESAKVKERVENHDRKNCWERNCSGILTYSAKYTPNIQQEGRKEIEKEIRDQYNPPCGKE